MTVNPSSRRRLNRGLSLAVIIVFFLFGYNSLTANQQVCQANKTGTVGPPIVGKPPAPPLPSACGCGGANSVPCTIPGSTLALIAGIQGAYWTELVISSQAVENYIGMAVDSLVQTVFSRLEQAELDLAEWFDTYWYYNLRPSMQAQTEQENVADFEQARQMASISDAEQQNITTLDLQAQELKSAFAMSDAANTDTCAVATSAGGLGRAAGFGRALRRSWQNNHVGDVLNRRDTPGARGVGAQIKAHSEEFENLFCDPADNGGQNNCGTSDPQFYNADTEVTARLYNALTIPMNEDERHNTAVEHMVDNMMGRARADVIAPSAMESATGKEMWMQRRSYAARKNATRAVPGLIAGWRVPGGGTGDFTGALREGAGVQLDNLSSNPSYREIIHAMTIDRFNSGVYALDKIGTPERQQMEKLVLSAMYLTQLRDYYELLERTALTLAVQVSVMADEYPLTTPGAGR